MAESNKINGASDSAAPQAQPGQVITPGGSPPAAESPAPPAVPAPSAPVAAEPQPAPPQLQAPAAAPAPSQPVENPRPELNQEAAPGQLADGISWTASEFIAHEKSASWYLGLIFITLAIAGLIFLVTKDRISTIVVLVGAFAFGALARRKPRQLQYQMDPSGMSIGQKHFAYEAFRSFSIVQEGAFSSIIFMPLKRFAPLTTIYYAPEDEDRIVNLLSKRLPFEEHKLDAVDHLMHRVRF